MAATVSTDRSVYVVDAASGECGAVLLGQSDPVTDVAFTLDCRFAFICIACVCENRNAAAFNVFFSSVSFKDFAERYLRALVMSVCRQLMDLFFTIFLPCIVFLKLPNNIHILKDTFI